MQLLAPLEGRQEAQWLTPAMYLLLTSVLLVPPSRARSILSFITVTAFCIFSLRFAGGQGMSSDFMIGSALATLYLSLIDCVLLDSPEKTMHKNNDQSAAQLSFFRKIWWSLNIWLGPRGVGWTHQARNTPTMPSHSKRRFVVQHVINMTLMYTLFDITCTTNAALYPSIFSCPPKSSILDLSVYEQILNCWAYIIKGYSSLNGLYSLLAVISIIVGAWNTSDFPPLFGRIMDAFTIRRAWSRVWHQLLQHMVSKFGRTVANDICRLQQGFWLSKYVHLVVAFTASGLLHMLASYWGSRSGSGDFTFFVTQAVGIAVEDQVIRLGRIIGIKDTGYIRFIGYIWTALFLGITMREWVSTLTDKGIACPPPPSLFHQLLD